MTATDHSCACEHCDPGLVAPDGPRQGENHAGVRFDDFMMTVRKDGVEIYDCYEVLAGRPGKAWRIRVPPHRHAGCPFPGNLCCYVDEGEFSVSIRVP